MKSVCATGGFCRVREILGKGMNKMNSSSDTCGRCGLHVYQFSRKLAQSDGRYYCIKCAEELDRNYLMKNGCSLCGRLLSKKEAKFVLPSSIYGAYSMPLLDRLACIRCYTKLLKRTRITRRVGSGARNVRDSIRKSIAKSLVMKKMAIKQ